MTYKNHESRPRKKERNVGVISRLYFLQLQVILSRFCLMIISTRLSSYACLFDLPFLLKCESPTSPGKSKALFFYLLFNSVKDGLANDWEIFVSLDKDVPYPADI